MRVCAFVIGTMVFHSVSPEAARAQQEPAVENGVRFLRGHYAGKQAGESAMIALGLLKAEVPHSDAGNPGLHRESPYAVYQ